MIDGAQKQIAALTSEPKSRSQVSLTFLNTDPIALTSEPDPALTSEPTIYILAGERADATGAGVGVAHE